MLNRTSPVKWLLLKSLMSIMQNAFVWIHNCDLEQLSTLHESNGAHVLTIDNFKVENVIDFYMLTIIIIFNHESTLQYLRFMKH